MPTAPLVASDVFQFVGKAVPAKLLVEYVTPTLELPLRSVPLPVPSAAESGVQLTVFTSPAAQAVGAQASRAAATPTATAARRAVDSAVTVRPRGSRSEPAVVLGERIVFRPPRAGGPSGGGGQFPLARRYTMRAGR